MNANDLHTMKSTQVNVKLGNRAFDGLPLATGTLIDGKYLVERVIGTGAMGVVVSALHRDLGLRVALKFLLPAVLEQHPGAVERFAREAQAAARVTCEHVVKVLDVARLPSGVPYIVMELVEGEDLEAVLMREVRLPLERAVDYIIQASVALAEAHVAGVVHRDLKPSNLFLARRADGSTIVKVLDFGISKISSDTSATAQAETSVGTPLYMSPEQLTSSHTVDQRSDVWALGMVLHELVTGEPAFLAGSVTEVCARILGSMPPPPASSRRPEVPPGLEAVIKRALSKKTNERYANVGEMARELVPFAPATARASLDRILRIFRNSGTWVPSVAPPAVHLEMLRDAYRRMPPSVAPAPNGAPAQRETAPRRLRRTSRVAIAIVGGVAALGLVGLVRRASGGRPTERVEVVAYVDERVSAPVSAHAAAPPATNAATVTATTATVAPSSASQRPQWTAKKAVVRKETAAVASPKAPAGNLYGGRK